MAHGASTPDLPFTTLSTKGQVVLPKAMRDDLGWHPGTKLVVEKTADGVTLRRPPRPPRSVDEVAGMLKYSGPPVSVEEMDEGIAELFRGEWGRQFDPS